MARNLTALEFKNLQVSDKDRLILDSDNLYVSIRSHNNGGSKSFRMTYRIDGKKKWITLEKKTLADAREERDKYKALVKKGLDPSLERKLGKVRESQKQRDELEAIAKLQARMTVSDLFVSWCETNLITRKDKAVISCLFDKDVLPDIGSLFVEDVRKGHITLIIAKLKKRGSLHMARHLLKLIRQMFRFAVTQDVIGVDPTASMNITQTTTKPTERDRVLDKLEIRSLARQLPDANLLKSTECAIWIALSTVCRIGELSKAKISDLDFENRCWQIPKENSKNKKAHKIYLSDFALEQFKVLVSISKSTIWLIPNRDGTSHVYTKSITDQVTSRQTEGRLVLSGGKWTPHDLRRTGATTMGDLGIAPDVQTPRSLGNLI